MEPPRKETAQDDLSLSLSLSLGSEETSKANHGDCFGRRKGSESLVVQKHPTILSTSRIDKGAGAAACAFFSFF
jgi:hypothetical protein